MIGIGRIHFPHISSIYLIPDIALKVSTGLFLVSLSAMPYTVFAKTRIVKQIRIY